MTKQERALEHANQVLSVLHGKTSIVDADVAESWIRSVNSHGLVPGENGEPWIIPSQEIKERQQEAEGLITIARYAMEDLYRRIKSLGYVLLLADSRGVTVDSIGDEKVDRQLRKAGLCVGANWSEELAGTNGTGACLLSGKPITVHMDDHFQLAHTQLSCTAAPIRSVRGEIIGALDMSLLTPPKEKSSQALALEILKSCVRRIEMANLFTSRKEDWILKLDGSAEFLQVDPECALSISDNGLISGVTSGVNQFISVGPSAIDCRELVGKPFDSLFNFDSEDIPCLQKAANPGEHAIETKHGNLCFADVISPRKTQTGNRSDFVPQPLAAIHGGDPLLADLAKKASRIVDKKISIILEGETGVCKEFVAVAIHNSRKKMGPFIAVNCAALPESLIESELFGYASNAFTGAASKGKRGLIESSSGGTLFLDEIGDMPLALQSRLLRVLAEQEVIAVGATQATAVDINVIAASHKPLRKLTELGQFRQDLYFRLNGIVLTIPPVRKRTDKKWLIQKVTGFAVPDGSKINLTEAASQKLLEYEWPGNIREMINVLKVCAALSDDGPIDVDDLAQQLGIHE